ncbi:MAG: LPS assembly lipoprotein LptE [Casimicrobiaceae bacterium]
MNRAAVAALASATLMTACGFHLRGDVAYTFPTIYVTSPAPQPIVAELKRTLGASAGTTKVIDSPKDAAVTLEIVSVVDDKGVLSLSGGGRVREFALTKRVSFNLRDKEGRDWMPAGEIVIRRSYTFNESEVLARESEETRILKEMQTDAVQQIVRRLQAARKPV